jgi:hypothetical protein
LFAGLLLAVAGFAVPDAGSSAEQASEVRAVRDGGGVEATGTVVELGEVQRTRSVGSRRTRRIETYTVSCPVYEYQVAKREYTYVETTYCDDAAVGDTEELIYDPAAPGHALNNDDAHLADEEKGAEQASTYDLWLKLAGVVLVVGSLIGFVLARRTPGARASKGIAA